jgi:uncharacterized protein DUF3606
MEEAMSDDATNREARDKAQINLDQDFERHDWAKSLGVTEDELKQAVHNVGDRAEKVREYLKNQTQRNGIRRAGYLRQRKRPRSGS